MLQGARAPRSRISVVVPSLDDRRSFGVGDISFRAGAGLEKGRSRPVSSAISTADNALLQWVADHGSPNDTDKLKKLKGQDDIWEFKTPGGLRLLCFWDESRLIVTTHGYLKGSQKAPKNELDRAQKLRRDYFVDKEKDASNLV